MFVATRELTLISLLVEHFNKNEQKTMFGARNSQRPLEFVDGSFPSCVSLSSWVLGEVVSLLFSPLYTANTLQRVVVMAK